MEKRQDDDGDASGQDLTLWSSFWSALSSDIAALSASESQLAAHSTFTTTRDSDMSGSTVVVTQATSTVYVSTTLISTTFVTVQQSPAPVPQTPSSSLPFSTTHKTIFTTSTHVPDISSTSPSASVSGISFQPLSVTTSTSSSLPSANASSTDSMTGKHSNSQKQAIVAGLSSTIAGLFIIGLLICLILRIRRKRSEPKEIDEDDDATAEKGGFRPALKRKWTRLTNGMGSPRAPPPTTATASPVIDEENRIIRMNTRHWPRPYAPGAAEGYRESMHQGTLRVVNPDAPSREGTPKHKSHPEANVQRLQRAALTGFVMGAGPRPPTRKSSRQALTTTNYQQTIPTIRVINPALSHEWVVAEPTATATTATQSFTSYPNDSLVSLPLITRHHPPEDPFYTSSSPPSSSPQPAAESPAIPRLKSTDRRKPQQRPSTTTTSTTATSSSLGSGGRTWKTTTTNLTSHLLHPFRGGRTHTTSSSTSRTPPQPPLSSWPQPVPTDEAAPSPSIGGHSTSSPRPFHSPQPFPSPHPSPRPSRRSDPFDLSVRGSTRGSTVFQYPWGG